MVHLLQRLLLHHHRHFYRHIYLHRLRLRDPEDLKYVNNNFQDLVRRPCNSKLFLLDGVRHAGRTFFNDLTTRGGRTPPSRGRHARETRFLLLRFATPFPRYATHYRAMHATTREGPIQGVTRIDRVDGDDTSVQRGASTLRTHDDSYSKWSTTPGAERVPTMEPTYTEGIDRNDRSVLHNSSWPTEDNRGGCSTCDKAHNRQTDYATSTIDEYTRSVYPTDPIERADPPDDAGRRDAHTKTSRPRNKVRRPTRDGDNDEPVDTVRQGSY